VTALILLAFAAVLTAVIPGRLARVAWPYRSPRLGLLAWQASVHAIVIALALAGAVSVLHWHDAGALACTVWRICLDALRGAHGGSARLAGIAGLALLAALVARLSAGSAQMLRTLRHRRRHRAMLCRAGRHDARLGATVISDPQPAAYLVPGRRPQVVVTTGALDKLSPEQLAAVVAHERAHAVGRHHWLRDTARLLQRAFPRVPVFAQAEAQVTRLVEMCADDVAAQRHPPINLARALVAMSEPGPVPGALHAAGGDAAERLRRLLQPPRPLPVPVRAATALFWTTVPLVPLLIVIATAA
jgi:Zn-dependent protease with chaperone function